MNYVNIWNLRCSLTKGSNSNTFALKAKIQTQNILSLSASFFPRPDPKHSGHISGFWAGIQMFSCHQVKSYSWRCQEIKVWHFSLSEKYICYVVTAKKLQLMFLKNWKHSNFASQNCDYIITSKENAFLFYIDINFPSKYWNLGVSWLLWHWRGSNKGALGWLRKVSIKWGVWAPRHCFPFFPS